MRTMARRLATRVRGEVAFGARATPVLSIAGVKACGSFRGF